MDVVERPLLDGAAAAPIGPPSGRRGREEPRRPGRGGPTGGLRQVKRRAWRAWLRARFVLFQRRRLDKPVVETVAGKPLLVLPEVLNPKIFFSGEFLAELLRAGPAPFTHPDGSGAVTAVLDMGTGSGVAAVFAAAWADRVAAIDINPAAVRCTRINALIHQVEDRVEVFHGDLFEPVRGRLFDVILFNPPYFYGQAASPFEAALRSTDVLERFVAGMGDHLLANGCALLLLSSAGEEQAWLDALDQAGYRVDAIARRDLVSEVLTIYRARRSSSMP